MNPSPSLFVAALALLGGCVSLGDTRSTTIDAYKGGNLAPALPIVRNLTSFSDGLRCMDELLAQHGAHLFLMVETIGDKTQKSPAGTTDMLLSALSSMSRRSQAIRAVAYGEDSRGITEFIRLAGTKGPFQPANVPAYTVRGGISQFDDSLARNTRDAGISLSGKTGFGFGAGKSSAINEIALDLNLVRAADFTLVPGVSSHNKAAILQDGSGRDADVSVGKLGINFQTSLAKSDGKAIALRNLVDLAAIELVGRATKTPYWQCIGGRPDHPEVLREVDDWFEAMGVDDKVRFYLQQFRAMDLFAPQQNIGQDDFKMAYAAYAEALAQTDTGSLSLKMFRAHFAADRARTAARTVELLEAARRQPIPIELKLEPAEPGRPMRPAFTSTRQAHVYCFLQDEQNKRIRGVYPASPQTALPSAGGRRVALNGAAAQAAVDERRSHSLACFASRQDLAKEGAELVRNRWGAWSAPTDWDTLQSRFAIGGILPGMAVLQLGRGTASAALENRP